MKRTLQLLAIVCIATLLLAQSHTSAVLDVAQTWSASQNFSGGIQLPTSGTGNQYQSGSCVAAWSGSGASFAMQANDDTVAQNGCYNDSGVTRTITAVKCRSDNAANTTVLTPTMGAAGTGTAILTGTVTCGNSYAYSATGTLANTSWTTGTGIDPGMSTVGNATSIAMIVEYTY